MSAWLAYLCSLLGHQREGIGWGTGADQIVWANYCSRCGAKLTIEAKR